MAKTIEIMVVKNGMAVLPEDIDHHTEDQLHNIGIDVGNRLGTINCVFHDDNAKAIWVWKKEDKIEVVIIICCIEHFIEVQELFLMYEYPVDVRC